jgi:glycosyl transferase family 87
MPSVVFRAERSLRVWAGVGLAGSVAVALTGPQLAGGPVRWWYQPAIGGHVAVFYAGIVALSFAWLALGRLAVTTRQARIVGALWCLPLFLTAPLFSQDVYSYLAQGTLVHLGLDPYHNAPAVLAQHGQAHMLNAVSHFWRNTTAPYGPLFLWIVSGFAAVAGSHLILGVLLVRALELVGLILLGVFVPRLGRVLGADPGRACWWVLGCPLVLLELVAAAHNDLLMVGLLVAGVTLAVERRPLPAVALCALAATIKLPAAAAIPFILVATGDRRTWARGALVAAGVVVAVSLVSGLGFGWLSSSVFSTPGQVRLAITPATAIGWTIAQLVPVGARGFESVMSVIAFGLSVLVGLVLLWRVRRETLARNLGIALVLVAVAGPAAWPWYLSWGLALLAATPELQASRWMAPAVALSVLVVKADGILAFPLHTAPIFVALYIALAIAAVRSARRPAPSMHRLRPRALAGS